MSIERLIGSDPNIDPAIRSFFCAATHTAPAPKPTIHEQMVAKLREAIEFIEENSSADFDCTDALSFLHEGAGALKSVHFDDSWRTGQIDHRPGDAGYQRGEG